MANKATTELTKPANMASSISGKLQLATLRKPTVDQLRDIVRDINDLRREVVTLGQEMARG